jgi:Cu-Zn family superoxide dismutase
MSHGDILSDVRHVGDYGNVETNANGNIVTAFSDTISKLYGPFGIIGRTLILHQMEDDGGLGNSSDSLVTGNAGARIACGVIVIL